LDRNRASGRRAAWNEVSSPAQPVSRDTKIFVHPGDADGEFIQVGFPNDEHISVPSNRHTGGISSGGSTALLEILRASRGNLPLKID
jgi:hypothetical protein